MASEGLSVKFAPTMPLHPRDPIFLLDSHEKFQPIAVESVEAVPAGLKVPPKSEDDGAVAPADKYVDGGEARLAALPPRGRINFPPGPEAQEARLRPELGGVGYRRQLEDSGVTWIQYWLWYLYNPKTYVGIVGEHEGDWEFVQVGYRDEEPICMTVSQHHSGGRRLWKDIALRDGRPLIYVARDSHANFFHPTDEIEAIADDADGQGAPLDQLEWRDFGPWASWNGMWGNSTGKGRSPDSPGRQAQRWYLPQSYYEAAERQ